MTFFIALWAWISLGVIGSHSEPTPPPDSQPEASTEDAEAVPAPKPVTLAPKGGKDRIYVGF
jgi:hypothetical protein